MVVSSAGLYWARAEWLVWGLMGLIGIAMLSSIAGEGGR